VNPSLSPIHKMPEESFFTVQWRGTTKGPWNLATLRAALDAGEINSLYQVKVNDQWVLLRDFLETEENRQAQAARLATQFASQQAERAAQAMTQAAQEREAYQARLEFLEESLRKAQQTPAPAPLPPAAPPPPANPYQPPVIMMAPPATPKAPPPANVGSLGFLIFIAIVLPILGILLAIIAMCGNETDRSNAGPVLLTSLLAIFLWAILFQI